MNDKIRELAEQAGIEFDDDFSLEPESIYYLKLSDFEKFAELIRADEREACAKVCETFYNHEAKDCAEAIRARSEK